MFHSQCSYIRTDDPSTKAMARRAFTVSWNVEVFVHSRSVVIPPPPPPGAPVTSFLSQQISTVIRSPRFQQDETSWALSSIAVVTKAIKRTARTSLSSVASGNSHNAVSRHLDKNRAKHRRTVFSMKKAQKSKQRSTNWRRRHLGDMQQQPRRWPGFDKCVETKLRWDVYIRPWPPGWSFWRHIYTSRGSERVKCLKSKRSSDHASVQRCRTAVFFFFWWTFGTWQFASLERYLTIAGAGWREEHLAFLLKTCVLRRPILL